MLEVALPSLPKPVAQCAGGELSKLTNAIPSCGTYQLFTADQMASFAREAVMADRRMLCEKWIAAHGFDKFGVVAAIRSLGE